MDSDRFDTLTRSFTASGSRRRALALALGGALAPLLARGETDAHNALKQCKKRKGKQKKGKQKKKCLKKAKRHKRQHARQRTSSPTLVLTYECPGPRESSFITSTARFAQTFAPAQSGSLHQIQFQIVKAASSLGDYVVQLLAVGSDGTPTDTVLAQVTIPNVSVPDGPSPLTASFSGPPLVAGAPYAAAISRPGLNDLEIITRVGNDCAGGLFNENPSGTGTFGEIPDHDLVTAVTIHA